ncbi:MAG TPA: hypothetical protein VH541_05460 [Gaiellaceae bacterium]|jgi:hypothetical protein
MTSIWVVVRSRRDKRTIRGWWTVDVELFKTRDEAFDRADALRESRPKDWVDVQQADSKDWVEVQRAAS